jgi:hypothetical protein
MAGFTTLSCPLCAKMGGNPRAEPITSSTAVKIKVLFALLFNFISPLNSYFYGRFTHRVIPILPND